MRCTIWMSFNNDLKNRIFIGLVDLNQTLFGSDLIHLNFGVGIWAALADWRLIGQILTETFAISLKEIVDLFTKGFG